MTFIANSAASPSFTTLDCPTAVPILLVSQPCYWWQGRAFLFVKQILLQPLDILGGISSSFSLFSLVNRWGHLHSYVQANKIKFITIFGDYVIQLFSYGIPLALLTDWKFPLINIFSKPHYHPEKINSTSTHKTKRNPNNFPFTTRCSVYQEL